MMDCDVAEEEERRDSFIYPLVFIFCFEKWTELGGPVWVEEGTQDDGGSGTWEDEASEAVGSSRSPSAVLQRDRRLNLTNT